MIAFGVCVGDEETYRRWALPSIKAVAEADTLLLASSGSTSIFSAYNEILDHVRGEPRVEALVLVHEDVELRDPRLLAKVRAVLTPESIGVAGAVGAVGVSGLAWWEGSGRGRCEETRGTVDFGGGTFDVETVDGLFMALAPRAFGAVRFDEESYDGFHGYDVDYCFEVRRAGLRVVVTDVDLFHHTKGGYGDAASFQRSDRAFRRKWSVPAPVAAAPLQLDLGGGRKARPGWTNLDPVHGNGPWRRRAQEVPWPVPDGGADRIFTSHMMEHIPAGAERIAVMNEAWRALRPGGTFEIRVPLFPRWEAVADPTHVSFWVPESFLYFTGQLAADADYGILLWQLDSVEVVDGWELRAVLRKPAGTAQSVTLSPPPDRPAPAA